MQGRVKGRKPGVLTAYSNESSGLCYDDASLQGSTIRGWTCIVKMQAARVSCRGQLICPEEARTAGFSALQKTPR